MRAVWHRGCREVKHGRVDRGLEYDDAIETHEQGKHSPPVVSAPSLEARTLSPSAGVERNAKDVRRIVGLVVRSDREEGFHFVPLELTNEQTSMPAGIFVHVHPEEFHWIVHRFTTTQPGCAYNFCWEGIYNMCLLYGCSNTTPAKSMRCPIDPLIPYSL